MDYSNLVRVDLEMLEKIVSINPEYRNFIDEIRKYDIENEQDFNKYLKYKEEFIQEQQEKNQKKLEELQNQFIY